jgi:two-component system, NarL family, nitrate/nitrite response regulator NarL
VASECSTARAFSSSLCLRCIDSIRPLASRSSQLRDRLVLRRLTNHRSGVDAVAHAIGSALCQPDSADRVSTQEFVAKASRILIVADRPLFREGLRRLLETEPQLTVVGEARDAEEGVTLVEHLRPDLLLLDLSVPQRSGLLALKRIYASGTQVRTILITARLDRSELVGALQLGARGVVTNMASAAVLLTVIRTVMDGHYWIADERVVDLADTFRKMQRENAPPAGFFGLTASDLEIVAMVGAGLTNRKIAETLSLSEHTVKHHLTKIFAKLGVSSRFELALFAVQHRLLDRVS